LDSKELKKYDGKSGQKAYVAADGKVYDVTGSRLWKHGQHMRRHLAGEDLTSDLADAPHGMEVFEGFDVMGDFSAAEMTPEELRRQKMVDLYKKFHPHPMFIHFPVALLNFAFLMQAAFLITGKPSYESAGLYALIIGGVSVIPAMLSGFLSWWINYECIRNPRFMVKIILSFMLVVTSFLAIYLRLANPDMVAGGGMLKFYSLLLLVNIPMLSVIGYNGGKLTWG